MTNKDLYVPSSDIIKNSHANKAEYERMYEESITSVSYTHLTLPTN